MAHKIRIACLGTSDHLSRAVDALLKDDVIPAENIFLSKADGPEIERFAASGCQLLTDDMNAIIKGEVVLIAAPSEEMAAVLAPVCGCTSGRYLIAVSDRVSVSDIADRIAKGTQIMAVQTAQQEDGTLHGTVDCSKGFASYMKLHCEDIARALVDTLTISE